MTNATETKTTTTTTKTTGCLCGCNAAASKWYRPGHDARHAGMVARAAADSFLNFHHEDYSTFVRDNIARALPSNALREKAINHFQKLVLKPTKEVREPGRDYKELADYHEDALDEAMDAYRDGVVEEVTKTEGTVKIGRWTYPAVEVDGKVWRNEKRDGSGDWIGTDAELITD